MYYHIKLTQKIPTKWKKKLIKLYLKKNIPFLLIINLSKIGYKCKKNQKIFKIKTIKKEKIQN